MSSSSISSSEEQTLMFQSTLPDIFDSLHTALHEIVQEKISTTLPFIPHDDEENDNDNDDNEGNSNGESDGEGGGSESESGSVSCQKKLHSRLCTIYATYLDAAEVYAGRELFSIPKGKLYESKKKRGRIVQEYLHRMSISSKSTNADSTATFINPEGKEITSIESAKKRDEINDRKNQDPAKNEEYEVTTSTPSTPQNPCPMPSALKDIPSSDEMNSLHEEIASLHQELRKVHAHTYSLQTQIKSYLRAQSSIEAVKDSIMQHMKDVDVDGHGHGESSTNGMSNITEPVKKIVKGHDQMKDLSHKGDELSNTMDTIKKERNANGDSNETKDFGAAIKDAAIRSAMGMGICMGALSSKSSTVHGSGNEIETNEHLNPPPSKKMTLEEDYQQRKAMISNKKLMSNLLQRR